MNRGRGLACGFDGGRAAVWTTDGAQVLKSVGRGPIYVVCFSPDDEHLACGSESKTAKLVPLKGKGSISFSGDSGIVNHLSFDSSGQHVLSGRGLWTRDGKAVLRKRFGMVSSFLPDDRIVSTGPDYSEEQANPSLRFFDIGGAELSRVEMPGVVSHLAATGSAEEIVVFGLKGDHCTLMVAEKSWLALGKDGSFQGDAALHPKATREDAGLLDRWLGK